MGRRPCSRPLQLLQLLQLLLLLPVCLADLEIFKDCAGKLRDCGYPQGKDASAKLGFELEINNDKEWHITISRAGSDDKCEISIGTNEKFKCGTGGNADQTLAGGTVTVKKEGPDDTSDLGFTRERYRLTSNNDDDPIIDQLKLYAQAKTKIQLNDDSTISEGVKGISLPGCSSDTYSFPGAEDAQQDATIPNKYTCSSPKKIHLNQEPLDVNTVYCSVRGWRKEDHTLIKKHEKQKVLCFAAPSPLPIFDNCDKKFCYIYDDMDNPTKLIKTTEKPTVAKPLGVELDTSNNKEWLLTLAWKGLEDKCNFAIDDLFVFSCANEDKSLKQPVLKVIVEQTENGKDENIIYEKFKITSTEDEPIVDIFKFYEKATQKLSLSGSNTNLESEITLFGGCKAGDSKYDVAIPAPKEVSKYSCSGRFNHVFLNDGDQFQNEPLLQPTAIYCSEKGWRKDNAERELIKAFDKENVFCYTHKPPNRLAIFDKCDGDNGKVKCYRIDDTAGTPALVETGKIDAPAKDALNKDIVLGVQLDTSNAEKWVLTMAWKNMKTNCKFTIGAVQFDCAKDMTNKEEIKDGAIFTKIGFGEDMDVQYEEYTITAKEANDPVVDALKLYENEKHKLKFSGGNINLESDEITLFAGCEVTSASSNPDAKPATKEVNKYSCSGRFNHVFINDNDLFTTELGTNPTAVYCSGKGWRAVSDRTVLKEYENDKKNVFCYTNKPPNRLAIFDKCDGDNGKVKCYRIDDTAGSSALVETGKIPAPAKDALNKDIVLGVQLDTSSDMQWVLTMAWMKMETNCKFTIGVQFECAKDDDKEQEIDGAIFKKTRSGEDLDIKYEEYTITAKETSDPVVDALKLYKELKHKLEFSGGGKTLTSGDIEFFKACTVTDTTEPFSKKTRKALQDHNRFECNSPVPVLLNEIYLNGKHQNAGSSVYCSHRGWRKEDGSFLKDFANDHPYCYSATPKSDIPMFEDCNKHVCYAFDHVQEGFSRTTPEYLIKKTQTTKITYPLGIDLDNSNDESWTLIISYENFEDLEFQIGALPAISIKGVKVEDEIPLTGFANVKVKYSKIGQDGTAFFHQFTFQPTKAGDSLIDSLKLYENEKYPIKLIFKGGTPFTHADAKDGIEFLKKGCDDGYFVFNRENSRPKVEHNKLSCPNDKPEHTVIFLDSKMLDGNILYCSKKGWRDANGNLIKVYKEEQAFCSTLCQDAAMKIINAVDSAGEEVKPKKDSDKFDYKCLQGKASIRINDKFYDNVKCESNKWTGDGEDIKLEYSEEKKLESYQFDAKCFGVFMFLKDNCDSETLKKTGCQQPKIINNEELKCDDGFALTYGNKIYQSLKIVKGAWKDQDGKDVENADEQKKPQCLSKCSREHVKMLGGELSEAADYNWDQATNTGTLSCIDKTNILIADFEGSAKSYFTDWTCDAKTEWKIKTGTEKKDLKSITDPAKFVVNAHCFKACDDSKVVNACDDTETECKKNKYADHELSCEAHEVMFLVDAGSKSEQEKKPLVCSAEGWKAKGDTILKYDHKVNKDVKISVQCVQKCAKRFRTDDVGPEYDGSVMTCKGTKMISYTYPPNQAKTTLEDLTCDYRDGWKDKKGKVIDFASGYKFKATCVDSCTNAWLVDNCRTAGRSVCETASLKSDLIKCEKEGFVLNYRDPTNPLQTAALEYKEISCSKTMFENTPSDTTQTKISVARVDTDTKINVECISKCDKQFVKLDDEQTRVPTLDPGKPNSLTKTDTELKCTDPLHYTTLLIDQKPVYTNDKFVCDPEKGWSASDLNGGNVLHEGHLAASKVGCYDVCKDRFTVAAGKDSGDYIKPTYTEGTIKTISCGDKHTMSIGKEEYLRETLECKDKGYLRKSNNEEIFSFDNNDATKQFEMHCFSNCMKELVTPDKTHLVSQVDDKKMKCAKDEILQIETGENSVISRVFSEATCEPDKGWHGELAKADNSGTEDGKFVDFATNVRLKASCRKVCSDVANFIDDCEGDEKSKDKTCHETRPAAETTGLSHLLKCNEHYRLFMKYGEATEYEETGPSKCARTGWTNEKDEIINDMNFMNPDVKIEQEVHYKCKHKCHPEFVQNSCVTEGKDPKDVTCSNFIYDVENRKMYCKHPSEVLVFEYAADSSLPIASKESFSTKVVNATCSDDGWKTEDGIDIFKMTADNFHISARCEQMCHPALLTQTTGSISYELGGKLTCTEEHEKLVFADNDWHTDLVCSATGWIDATFNKNVATAARAKPLGQIDFVADTARTFKAECIHSKCINQDPNFDRCAKAALEGNEQKRECSKPDFESRKYYVSCEDPMRIVKAGFPETIVQVLLRCAANSAKDDTWRTWDETNHEYRDEFQDATPEEFICFAGECAQCEATLKNGTCGSSDVNCKAASFNKGSASFCSNYYCNGLGYRFGDAQSNYKYYNGSGRVTCMTPGTFKAPDLASTISAPIACVYQIPCVDYAPLNTTCAGLAVSCDEEGLKQNLTAASKYGASPIQSTEDHQLYYSTTGGPPWTNFDRLKCDKNGKWEAYDKSDAVTYLEEKTRVVWTESDPAGPKPSTTTPKPGICSFCALPPKKECDGCSTDAITTKEVNGTCTATTTNGHFVNEKKEKVEALKCKDEKTGVYVWRDGKGNEVKSLAVVADNPIIAGANPGMIAGIVIGVLCVIGGVAGLVVFMHVRKKKEAARLETLKSKGLETKNDSIIDQIEVDDPKTIRL